MANVMLRGSQSHPRGNPVVYHDQMAITQLVRAWIAEELLPPL